MQISAFPWLRMWEKLSIKDQSHAGWMASVVDCSNKWICCSEDDSCEYWKVVEFHLSLSQLPFPSCRAPASTPKLIYQPILCSKLKSLIVVMTRYCIKDISPSLYIIPTIYALSFMSFLLCRSTIIYPMCIHSVQSLSVTMLYKSGHLPFLQRQAVVLLLSRV